MTISINNSFKKKLENPAKSGSTVCTNITLSSCFESICAYAHHLPWCVKSSSVEDPDIGHQSVSPSPYMMSTPRPPTHDVPLTPPPHFFHSLPPSVLSTCYILQCGPNPYFHFPPRPVTPKEIISVEDNCSF
jgi:hypothetical protein